MLIMRREILSGRTNMAEHEQVAHDMLLALGGVTVRLAAIDRAPRYGEERPENDAEHSFHLALSATELAATFFPELDAGLVAQFSLVHDLPEVYAGDVHTFIITPEALEEKAAAEKEATERLLRELPPHTANLLRRYELQEEVEARFVRFVDKILPSIINIVGGEGRAVLKDNFNVQTVDDLRIGQTQRLARLQEMFPDFPFLHAVEGLVSGSVERVVFSEDQIIEVVTVAVRS